MLQEFFAKHPAFTVDELTAFLVQRGGLAGSSLASQHPF